MKKEERNSAYIDGANLHRGIQSQGWNLDYRRFRTWLREKLGVNNAYLFLGMIPRHRALYQSLQEEGIVSPSQEKKCSILLKRANVPITYLGQPRLRPHVELRKEKAPDADGTAQGSSSW